MLKEKSGSRRKKNQLTAYITETTDREGNVQYIAAITAVRLKLEENQLVGVFV